MAAVRASTRVSIAWSGDSAFEDTDTLVLTIDDYSLDLRVFNEGVDAGKIDWSTVAYVKQLEGSTKENPFLRWDHIIDSRPPTDMEDQGSFDTLPNGDVREVGIMHNTKTNEYEKYIEIWRRYPSQSGAPYCVLERIEPEGSSTHMYLGRVGDRLLGIGKSGEGDFYAIREEYKNGQWTRLYEFGPSVGQILPSLPVDTVYTAGETVELGGHSWLVRTAGELP